MGRNAEQFFICIITVKINKALTPFVLGFLAPFFARTHAYAFIQALLQGLIKGHGVQAVRSLTGPDLFNEEIEFVLFSVMGGYDHNPAAPHQKRNGCF